MKFLSLGLGLAAGNFIYQYFGDANWSLAIDRTFFQTGAIAACWIMSAMSPAHRGDAAE